MYYNCVCFNSSCRVARSFLAMTSPLHISSGSGSNPVTTKCDPSGSLLAFSTMKLQMSVMSCIFLSVTVVMVADTPCELVFSTGLWSCSCISTGSLDTIIMIAIKHQKRVTSLHMIRQVLHEVHDLVLDCTVGRPLYNPEHRLPLSSNRDVGTGEHSYTITSFKSSSQACSSPSKRKYIRFVSYTSTWPTLMCLRATAILTTFFGIDLLKIPCHCASYYSICPVTIFRSTASCIGSGYVSGGCATWKIFSKLRTVYLIGLYLAWLFLLVLGHCDLLVTVCHGLHILCKSTTDVD